MQFAKGHGTENDFIVLPDPDGEIDLTPGLVARLCDRRAGLGADGVLRAVRVTGGAAAGSGGAATAEAGSGPAATTGAGAEWFMDYRNADGSLAETCGNGIRVFARYLLDHGLVAGPEFAVVTRGGTRLVRAEPDGEITVDMGPPLVLGAGRATLAGQPLDGLRISLGNPHLACLVDTPLAEFDLSRPPVLDAGQFPAGANLELVRVIDAAHILMRVYERGSGPTRSCGTGAVAAAVAVAAAAAPPAPPSVPAAAPPRASAAPPSVPAAAPPSVPAAAPPRASAAPPSVSAAAPPRASAAALAAPPASADPPLASAGPPQAAADPPPAGTWIVDLPGGRLRVTLDGRTSFLSGPAVIVAEGKLDQAWLSGKPVTPDQSSAS